jgi:nicotinate dehydrogenase subunit A
MRSTPARRASAHYNHGMGVTLSINGARHDLDANADAMLLPVLRDIVGLTGAKYGCGEGQCGACTVLVGDRAVRACITPVRAAAGQRITTIEGLASGDRLHPVQQAFMDAEALQCGYCTPGMILGAVALLRAKAQPSRDEIVHGMTGHVCRCGVYPRIVAAIEAAAGRSAVTSAARGDR